jgi:hypothetical protein
VALIGLVRVSTGKQKTRRQHDDPRPCLPEGVRGAGQRQAQHRGSARAAGGAVPHPHGDMLAVQEAGRLGRNLLDGLGPFNQFHAKMAAIRSQRERENMNPSRFSAMAAAVTMAAGLIMGTTGTGTALASTGPASAAAAASHAVITYRYVPTGADLAPSPASTMSAVSPDASDPGCPNPFNNGNLPCALPPAHHCIQVANANSVSAIFCVDLIVGLVPGSRTILEAGLQISGYCQDAAGYNECSQVVARGVTGDPANNTDANNWQKICKANSPVDNPCAAHDRNFFSHDFVTISPGTTDEVWGVLRATSSIQLPNNSNIFGFLQENFETGHWNITNGN